MDLTLKQIIDRTDEIHRQVDRLDNSSNIYELIKDLDLMFRQLKSVGSKVSNIYNICNNKHKTITREYKKEEKTKPDENWTCINRQINSYTTHGNLTKNIKINVKIISDIGEIPNMPLYWVSNINQFAIQLNGVIFRGNIGNIYNSNDIKMDTKLENNQIVICKYGSNCKNIADGKICKFFHDPLDLLQLVNAGKMTAELYNIYKEKIRNFVNTSWIYTEFPNNYNNSSMRHFGSRNVLHHELDLMKLNNNYKEIDNFRHQCIHDILVVMGLNQYGLV